MLIISGLMRLKKIDGWNELKWPKIPNVCLNSKDLVFNVLVSKQLTYYVVKVLGKSDQKETRKYAFSWLGIKKIQSALVTRALIVWRL